MALRGNGKLAKHFIPIFLRIFLKELKKCSIYHIEMILIMRLIRLKERALIKSISFKMCDNLYTRLC